MKPAGGKFVTTSMAVDAPSHGISCHGCNQCLPLRLSRSQEVAALWECTACGASFAGVFIQELAPSLAQSVRLAQLHFEADHAEPISDTVRQVLANVSAEQLSLKYMEARRGTREPRWLKATAIGFDADLVLVGPTCRGIVANLSSHGMLLLTAVQLHSAAVAVQMQGGPEKIQVLGRIVWSRFLGHGCYGTGVDFAAQLGKVPPANVAPLPAEMDTASHSSPMV
jgi:ribosomal protein L37AE/L43A